MFVLEIHNKKSDLVWSTIKLFDSKESLINYYFSLIWPQINKNNKEIIKEYLKNKNVNETFDILFVNDIYQTLYPYLYRAYELNIENISLSDLEFVINSLDILQND